MLLITRSLHMANLPPTLRQMQGLPGEPAKLDDASLVIIDIQEEYRSGKLPLEGVNEAAAAAKSILEIARKNGLPIMHVLHKVSDEAPIFNPSLPSYAVMAEVAPRAGEALVVKSLPNAFANTNLDDLLKATGRKEIIFVGMMTHTCVSATVRAALDLGYRSTVVADACATRPLPTVRGTKIEASNVHEAALAELADAFAIVVPNANAWLSAVR